MESFRVGTSDLWPEIEQEQQVLLLDAARHRHPSCSRDAREKKPHITSYTELLMFDRFSLARYARTAGKSHLAIPASPTGFNGSWD